MGWEIQKELDSGNLLSIRLEKKIRYVETFIH